MSYILSLPDARATLEIAGGKGMSLMTMSKAGLPVPDGFHVTTPAYRRFVEENGIGTEILGELEGISVGDMDRIEKASENIGKLFACGTIPEGIRSEVSSAYERLSGNDESAIPVAVRSSATAEDLPGASFAGQQETYLNIRGTPAVLEAVKKCWASLWTARAISYRMKNGIDNASVALAVVVQALVPADAAGIMFTVNPVNGRRGETVINAAWGLGEAVVGGLVTPDTIIADKSGGRVLKREIADKTVMTVRTEDGTHEVPVPENRRKRPVLSPKSVAELVSLGKRLEELYGMPMDVEWAYVGYGSGSENRFAILQARPITALPPEWIVPDPKAVYARGSLAEHTPSPVTPLFGTLGLELANEATRRLWERTIGKHAEDLLSGEGFYLPLNGYVYGGVRMRCTAIWPVIRMTLNQMGPVLKGSVERWKTARAVFARIVRDWEEKPLEELSDVGLLEGIRTVFSGACRYFTDIQMTLPAASTSEVLFVKFYNGFVRRKHDPDATVFLLGSETAAARMERSLYDLAVRIREQPALNGLFRMLPSVLILEAYENGISPDGIPPTAWQEFSDGFRAHLEEFGRTAYEFDFAHPTPSEAPLPLIDAVKTFLEEPAKDPAGRRKEAVSRREEATAAILSRIGVMRGRLFGKLLRWARETGPMREDAIFDMGMGHPLVRRMFALLGNRLAGRNLLERADDIYWLEVREFENLVSNPGTGENIPDLTDRIAERKRDWERQRSLIPPVLLPEKSGWSRMFTGGASERKDGRIVLKGIGTSAGIVTARACVLSGPGDFNLMRPGDVLVAVTTTPAWTPLFATASAVITDIGGPLSHSSIVAREYGIPAIMAVRDATRKIRQGVTVRVDGSAGTVTILE